MAEDPEDRLQREWEGRQVAIGVFKDGGRPKGEAANLLTELL
jgi:hypothetical protein